VAARVTSTAATGTPGEEATPAIHDEVAKIGAGEAGGVTSSTGPTPSIERMAPALDVRRMASPRRPPVAVKEVNPPQARARHGLAVSV